MIGTSFLLQISQLNLNFRSDAVDILEEALKGGRQEASKDGHQEVANLPPFKRERKYEKIQGF